VRKLLELFLVLVLLSVFAFGMYYWRTATQIKIPFTEKTVEHAVVIVSTAPYQLLVTYPDGKKTGLDPKTGKEINQITDSKYYLQPAKKGVDNGSYWLGLPGIMDSFTLQVIGDTNTYYSFGVYVFNKGKQETKTYWGKIAADNTATYQVTKTSDQSFPLEVTLIK
jgi:hypothetical protein